VRTFWVKSPRWHFGLGLTQVDLRRTAKAQTDSSSRAEYSPEGEVCMYIYNRDLSHDPHLLRLYPRWEVWCPAVRRIGRRPYARNLTTRFLNDNALTFSIKVSRASRCLIDEEWNAKQRLVENAVISPCLVDLLLEEQYSHSVGSSIFIPSPGSATDGCVARQSKSSAQLHHVTRNVSLIHN
jgi:hypothetical protein